MAFASIRTFRYLGSWLTGRDDLVIAERILDRNDVPVPATLVIPRAPTTPLPVWVVLHGITRPGREHAQLVRFVRAVSAGKAAVLVPEVPEWRELSLAPGLTLPTILAALRAVETDPALDADRVGLVGFSFGAPQALAASAHPDLRRRISGVVGFGGYCDLERTILFQLTGRHDWEGEAHRLRPDPYGRWIVAANYLTCVPGFEDAREAADGLREMAALAGDVGVISWDPSLDAAKEEIRARIPAGHQRDAFSFFCPTRGADPDGEEAVAMAHALAAAARRADPDIEPAPQLRDVPGPVHLLHGQQDHLIPFTELHRLHAALPPHVSVQATVTPLFGHSSQDPFPGVVEGVRETARFLRALDGVLGVIEKPPAR